MAIVMGMNLSNKFMSTPQPLVDAWKLLLTSPTQGGLGINFVKLFDWDGVNRALIEYAQYIKIMHIALGIPNDRLQELADPNGAKKVLGEIERACSLDKDVEGPRNLIRFTRWICVGNEPLGSWHGDKYLKLLTPAVTNLYNALQASVYTKNIGVVVPQNFQFMANSWPPSAGKIKDNYKQTIKETCGVIRQKKGAPFMVNIYPFLTRKDDPTNVPLDYALFTKQTAQFQDQGKSYFNLFDAMLDALHFALADIQCQDLEIVVGECGWPTAGHPEATKQNAQTFLTNLITHCRSGKGTPMRPNKTIQCFVFEMYDEDKKDAGPGREFEHYWGICDGQGKPKFPSIKW